MHTFRPLGAETTADTCLGLALNNGVDKDIRFGLLALDGLRAFGWGFLWDLDTGKPVFGLVPPNNSVFLAAQWLARLAIRIS